MKITKKIETEILHVYHTWLHSYITGDVDTYDLYLDDAYHFIGSTDNEEFLNRGDTTEFFRVTADQFAGKTELRNEKKIIECFGDLIFITHVFDAWFLSEADWVYYGRFRFSSVMRKNKEGWRFIYQHFSMPDARAEEGETIGYDQISAENLQLREAIKRRTIELENKNRELEIETALERVRAVSMSMQTPSDLAKIGEVLFQELKALGFEELRNTEIIINHNTKEAITSYYYSDYGVTGVIEVDYRSNPVLEQWARELQKADDAFAEVRIPYNEIKEWRTFRSSLGYAPDPKLVEAKEVYYYSYSIGLGAVSISSFHAVSANQLRLLQRFRNVFNLSYQRYVDITVAEEQALEARVELSLERIRAQVTAMKESAELLDIVVTMRAEFIKLGHEAHYFWHMRWLPDTYNKAMTSGDGTRIGMVMELPRYIHGNIPVLAEWEKSDKPTVVYAMDTEAALVYVDKMVTLGDFQQVDPQAPGPDDIRHIGGLTFVMARTTHGEIGYSLPGVVPNPPAEDLATLVRFAGVFDLAYKRFEDLKNAERQHREVQVELALERVRARTMAMQKSEELADAAFVLFEQLRNLGGNLWGTGFGLCEKDGETDQFWFAYEKGVLPPASVPNTTDPAHIKMYEGWKDKQDFVAIEASGEDLKKHYEYMMSLDEVRPFFQEILNKGLSFPDWQQWNAAYFTYGYLLVISLEPYPEPDILRRFARVFDQTYTRFLDLKKAEAQAREAQIEAALEKVRTRSMAMHKSEDLAELSLELVKQVHALGVKTWFCAFNIYDEDAEGSLEWGSNGEGTFPKYRTPREGIFLRYYEEGQKGETLLINKIREEECAAHYEYLCSLPGVGEQLLKMKDAGIPFPTSQIDHVAYFKYGYILFITYEPSLESHDIFKRFARVFEQTYTRFLDLKKVEAQARSAKIETALERVRARALAMQNPEELRAVAEVLRYEMGLLGVEELETSSIYINDPESRKTECWYALKDIRSVEKKLVSDYFPLNLNETWVGREMKKFYDSSGDQVSIVMKGEARKEWIRYCEKYSEPFRDYYGEVIPDRTYHLFKFSNGAIGAAAAGDISGESWDLLKRAAAVFSLAYSRFKDLTQARLDLQKLKEEKKRAEEALNELQITQTQLIQSEKMASLGELTAGIAHEIQNPLNFVNNFSEVSKELIEEMLEEMQKGDVEEVKALAEDIIQNLEKINHHGKRADGIVKGMLQHSRTSSGEKEATDINILADEYLRLAYHGLRAKDKGFNATLETHFDKTIGKVNVVSQDIGRVILNLITNAFYVVREKKEQQPEGYEPIVTVTTKKEGNKVMIMVKDNGNGIPEAIREKIFQPFFTTKPTGQGTGLGLSMSYDIVTKGHGGELKVETKEGEGTEFKIVLPGKEK